MFLYSFPEMFSLDGLPHDKQQTHSLSSKLWGEKGEKNAEKAQQQHQGCYV